jgi:hypothetical protein
MFNEYFRLKTEELLNELSQVKTLGADQVIEYDKENIHQHP